jgi:hypothetical protein
VLVQITGGLAADDALTVSTFGAVTSSYDASSGLLTLGGDGSDSDLQQTLQSLQFVNTDADPSESGTDLARTIFVSWVDGSHTASPLAQLTVQTPTAVFAAGAPYQTPFEGAMHSLGGAGNIASASVSIVSGFDSAGDQIGYAAAGGVSGSWDATSGVLTLIGDGSDDDMLATLQSLSYGSTQADPTLAGADPVRVIDVQVTDGVTVTDLGSAQLLTLAPQSWGQNSPPVGVDANVLPIGVAQSATVTVTRGLQSGDELGFTVVGGVTGMWDSNLGVLTLTGDGNDADLAATLQSVTFDSTAADPTAGGADLSRTLVFQSFDGAATSPLLTSIVAVSPVSLSDASPSAGYTPPAAPVAIAPDLVVADSAGLDIVSASVAITSGFLAGDQLSWTAQSGITGAYDAATGVLRFTGSASVADYQTLLEGVSYASNQLDPTSGASDGARAISFAVNDGLAPSNTLTDTLFVSPTAPGLTLPATAPLFVAGSGPLSLGPGLTLSSPVGEIGYISILITDGQSGDSLSLNAPSDIVVFNFGQEVFLEARAGSGEPLADWQTALNSLTFNSTASDPTMGGTTPTRDIQFSLIGDQFYASATVDLTLDVSVTSNVVTAPALAILTSGGLTNQPTQVISGTVDAADAGATISVYDGGALLGSTAAVGQAWSLSATLSGQGEHDLIAEATNAGGTGSSSQVVFTLDTVAPSVVLSSAGGEIHSGGLTLSGTIDAADAGRPVSVFDGATLLGLATPTSGGAWTLPVTLSGAGAHDVFAQASDAAGNTGASTSAVFTLEAFATDAFALVSGAGVFTSTGAHAYSLDLGDISDTAAALVATIGVMNTASGLADLLSGAVSSSGDGGAFVNALLGASGLANDGSTLTLGTVSLEPTTVGAFTETLTFTPSGAYASGVAAATLVVSGMVSDTAPALSAPVSAYVHAGYASPISGVSIADADATSQAKTFSVTVSAASGALSTTAGQGVIAGGGTASLTLGGSLAQVNADLAGLGLDAAAGADSLAISVADGLGGVDSATVSVGAANLAAPAISATSGAGTLTSTGPDAYALKLGSVFQGAATLGETLALINTAAAPGDAISGAFTSSGAVTAFADAGFGAVTSLGAGGSDGALSVALQTTSAGAFVETLTFSGQSVGAAGDESLTPVTLTVSGTVIQTQFALTTGSDAISGGAGHDVIVATSGTLTSGDHIDGGSSGHNLLELVGGGSFDLTAPASLADIQTLDAQEGSGATEQTLTLRAGTSLVVNVADASPETGAGIVISGAANSDQIHLGDGADTLTVGGAGESVIGGSGSDLIILPVAYRAASLNGGGAGTLELTGGGAITLGSNISGFGQLKLAKALTNWSVALNAESGLAVTDLNTGGSGDVVTLHDSSQSVTDVAGSVLTVNLTAADASALVLGASGAITAIALAGGGSAQLNDGDANLVVEMAAGGVLELGAGSNITAYGGAGPDTIIAGGAQQTLSGAGGANSLTGSSAGYDTFLDTAANFASDTISNLAIGDVLDVSGFAYSTSVTLSVREISASNITIVSVAHGRAVANVVLFGQYAANLFSLSAGVHGETLITYDPSPTHTLTGPGG